MKSNWIKNAIDISKEKKVSDIYILEYALTELRKRKVELTLLFKECVEKGISIKEICPELNEEWNEIVIALNGR
jgi:hypothetical protein